jgi:hypothetical protein
MPFFGRECIKKCRSLTVSARGDMKLHPAEITDDPLTLEMLYREARANGGESSFREAIRQRLSEHTRDALTLAWAVRLDLALPDAIPTTRKGQWQLAIASAVMLGLLFALLRGGGPPLPVPEVADTLFWVGWGPLAGVVVALYFIAFDRARLRAMVGACLFNLLIAAYTAFAFWRASNDAAQLAALHLPFVIWGALGIGLTFRDPNAAVQRYAYLVKSFEIVMTAVIYLGAYGVFLGLTTGIFSVLDVTFSEAATLSAIAWGIGAALMVALASAYLPDRLPTEQDWEQGLGRTLRLMTRLLMPLALLVVGVYLVGYIPFNFGSAFEQRELLVVYNATIVAIIMLLCAAASGRREQDNQVLRYALLSLAALTLVLNLYALAAIAYRTLELGLTPNRHAVLGWNIVTLVLLAGICHSLRPQANDWACSFSRRVGHLLPVPLVWSVCLLVALPFFR